MRYERCGKCGKANVWAAEWGSEQRTEGQAGSSRRSWRRARLGRGAVGIMCAERCVADHGPAVVRELGCAICLQDLRR